MSYSTRTNQAFQIQFMSSEKEVGPLSGGLSILTIILKWNRPYIYASCTCVIVECLHEVCSLVGKGDVIFDDM